MDKNSIPSFLLLSTVPNISPSSLSFFMAWSLPSFLPISLHTPSGPCRTHKGERSKLSFADPVFGFSSWVLLLKRQQCFVVSRNSTEFKFLSDHTGMPSTRYYQGTSYSDLSASPLYTDCVDDMGEKDFNRIAFLVQILHHSASSFTTAIRSHKLAWEDAQVAKAWIGVDVHAWHKRLAYQAAVYALLQTAIGSWIRLYNDRERDLDSVQKILFPRMSTLQDHIEHQLNMRNTKLVEWFKTEQLPVLAGHFTPLLGKWSADYYESGAAVIILAISCCLAIRKLGARRISFPLFTSSIPELVGKLMNLVHDLVPLDKLHKLASVAGFEHEFFIHYGSISPHCNASEDVLFWMSLVQRKLIFAFQREGFVASLEKVYDPKILESDIAILGLFAYLGRKTRLFLSYMGIKDLDEPVKDFLSYLECGSLFIYPALSSVSVYQHFIEVVTEEIGWLNFYTAVPSVSCQVRRRMKQHAIQAEKEIIFSTVFKVCSDLFSRFAHFSKSTQLSLSPNLVTFLLRSQNMLNICLEDYWASYDGSSELKIIENGEPEERASVGNHEIVSSVTSVEKAQWNPVELATEHATEHVSNHIAQFCEVSIGDRMDVANSRKILSAVESKVGSQCWVRRSTEKMISATLDIYVGTRLLFVDMSVATVLLWKQVCRQTLTHREAKKLRRTLADVASVIPVAILMLLPLSAVGHAAILAAIKKYAPCLIPSPYSSARLDVIKQLNRTKEMDLQSLSNLDISSL